MSDGPTPVWVDRFNSGPTLSCQLKPQRKRDGHCPVCIDLPPSLIDFPQVRSAPYPLKSDRGPLSLSTSDSGPALRLAVDPGAKSGRPVFRSDDLPSIAIGEKDFFPPRAHLTLPDSLAEVAGPSGGMTRSKKSAIYQKLVVRVVTL